MTAPTTPPALAAEGDARCAATVPVPGKNIPDSYVRYDAAGTQAARATAPDSCCYSWMQPCGGGRALRDDEGQALTTPAGRAPGWVPAAEAHPAPSVEAPSLAAYWAEQAGYEHASVASFARTTLELLALGAPAALVQETQAAGLDEVRHAQALYAVARRLGAHDAGPGPIATDRPLARDLASFAIATFEDACIGETVGALAARRAAETAEDPALAEVLSGIAVDEERHAELAWRTLAWAIRVGGEAAVHALRERVGALEAALSAPQRIEPGSAPPHDGLLDAAVAAETHRRALAEVVLPCARALLA